MSGSGMASILVLFSVETLPMKWSRLFQVLLGSSLGLVIVVAALGGIGYLLTKQWSRLPPRPVFENERPTSPTAPSATSQSASPATSSYKATVNFPEGLIVRDAPDPAASEISGVDFQQIVVVLAESADKQWQKIRSESGEVEGWVRSGNVERLQ